MPAVSDVTNKYSVEIKHANMSPEMQEAAISIGVNAVSSLESESKMASHIKKEFDAKFDGKWHCVVGRAYGSYVTHDLDHFIYFQVGNEVVLLFKST